MENIIPAELITAITGATTQAEIKLQGCAIIEILEAYLGVLLVKRDITDEKITQVYNFSRIIKPKYMPINSVSSLKVADHKGEYIAKSFYYSVGRCTVEVLPCFWAWYRTLPRTVAGVKLSYNAGYYSTWQEFPAILQQAALDLLKYKYASDLKAGFQSEHLGDYSYTKGAIVRGLPVEIATVLDGVIL